MPPGPPSQYHLCGIDLFRAIRTVVWTDNNSEYNDNDSGNNNTLHPWIRHLPCVIHHIIYPLTVRTQSIFGTEKRTISLRIPTGPDSVKIGRTLQDMVDIEILSGRDAINLIKKTSKYVAN